MRKVHRILTLFLALVLIAPAVFAGGGGEKKDAGAPKVQRLSLATGGTAGTYYPIGAAITNVITKNVPGVEVTAEATGASVANLKMIAENKVDFMMGAANTSYGGFTGEDPFPTPISNIRGMMALYPETFQFVVLKSSGLKTLSDLRGKRVVVGAPGSGTERTAKLMLEAHGIDYSDIKPQFLSFGEGVTALKDRLVDCAIVGAGTPTSAVVDAAASLDINLLSVKQEAFDKVGKDIQYLTMVTIPAGTYRGVDEDIRTVASPALLITRMDMDDDVIYDIIAALFDNLSDIHASHVQGKSITLETALNGMSLPLHPGAERYFKEKGILK